MAPDQIIDYTHAGKAVFFDGVAQPLQHIDFTRPSTARCATAVAAGMASGESFVTAAFMAATPGAAPGNAAEIDRMARVALMSSA